jgi:hypothetical protein
MSEKRGGSTVRETSHHKAISLAWPIEKHLKNTTARQVLALCYLESMPIGIRTRT